MKLGIAAKLFCAVLAACAIVLFVNAIAGRIAFRLGFLGYLNEQGVERMQEVVPQLEAAYQQHGNWNFLRGDIGAWFALMRPSPDSRRTNLGPPVSDQTGAVPRFGLLDRDYAWITGNPQVTRESIIRPITVNGDTVGWLAMLPFQQAIAAGDVRFYRTQLKTWWVIGTFSVLVAALLSWWLARITRHRLQTLTRGTRQLAAGRYDARVKADSHDELGGLARDFNHLAQALEHNERARRNFMADISHELRTPLAVMQAELDAIVDGIRKPDTASITPLLGQVQQLSKLVDDLHDLSLTDVGSMAYRQEPIDIATLLRSMLASMHGRFADAGLTLHDRLPAGRFVINGDERRLQQLFANLFENTLRYTDRGGTVDVYAERQGDELVVSIDDSAPGVDDAGRARIFERFYRTDSSRNRASGGSGLGLAICRNIVEAHDGTISADTSALGGLRIVIRLPEVA
ncbi:sensor histidine kinase efflux regulator BaeS [Solimonas marina]|uniref:histidine kinase n=1 Tax=Solimonas marina TaxID=2714601 RepID=A0A970B9N0_9GAMM|nr:sensor histidine kinase efflux regulator BaeS [Solimonas marina]NKF23514.1 sensor histidine kinase efflux regulator BaeS [Solimonas marina]